MDKTITQSGGMAARNARRMTGARHATGFNMTGRVSGSNQGAISPVTTHIKTRNTLMTDSSTPQTPVFTAEQRRLLGQAYNLIPGWHAEKKQFETHAAQALKNNCGGTHG
jgi:hypothetical protein